MINLYYRKNITLEKLILLNQINGKTDIHINPSSPFILIIENKNLVNIYLKRYNTFCKEFIFAKNSLIYFIGTILIHKEFSGLGFKDFILANLWQRIWYRNWLIKVVKT